jgi:hypothetical protein
VKYGKEHRATLGRIANSIGEDRNTCGMDGCPDILAVVRHAADGGDVTGADLKALTELLVDVSYLLKGKAVVH